MVATEVLGKRLELLYEAMPNPGCVAVLSMSGVNYDPSAWQELAGAAKSLRVALQPILVRDASELAAGFTTIVRSQCRAALVMPDPLFVGVRQALVELAAQHRIAVSYDNRLIAEAGGLMSYGPDTVDMYRRSASYVDKILKGAKPRRAANRAADQIRAGHQPQDREGARPHYPAIAARPRRRGDRISRRRRRFAALQSELHSRRPVGLGARQSR